MIVVSDAQIGSVADRGSGDVATSSRSVTLGLCQRPLSGFGGRFHRDLAT